MPLPSSASNQGIERSINGQNGLDLSIMVLLTGSWQQLPFLFAQHTGLHSAHLGSCMAQLCLRSCAHVAGQPGLLTAVQEVERLAAAGKGEPPQPSTKQINRAKALS